MHGGKLGLTPSPRVWRRLKTGPAPSNRAHPALRSGFAGSLRADPLPPSPDALRKTSARHKRGFGLTYPESQIMGTS